MASKSASKVALFDLDGSLADYDGAMREGLRLLRAPSEPEILDDTDLHALEDAQEHIERRMTIIKSLPGYWRSLERIEMGFQVLRAAATIGFAINVLTKGPSKHSNAWMEKLDWCKDQPELTDADVHMTMNKGLVYGLMLYDDFPPYMDAWLAHRPRGLGIMPATRYNVDYHHPNVIKWDSSNFDAVVCAMQAAFNRGPREDLVLSATRAK